VAAEQPVAVDRLPARALRQLARRQRRAARRRGAHRALLDRVGTKLAMEDAIALSQAFVRHPGDVERALVEYRA
jgi:hypothetical protein